MNVSRTLSRKCEHSLFFLKDVYIGLLLTRLALLTTELEGRRREHANVLQELDKCRKKVADFKRQVSYEMMNSLQVEKNLVSLNTCLNYKQTQISAKILDNSKRVTIHSFVTYQLKTLSFSPRQPIAIYYVASNSICQN